MANRDGFIKIQPTGNVVYAQFQLHKAITAAARAAVHTTRIKMSDTMGAGRKYRNLPNPSSSPDEYPVRQTGQTLDALGMLVEGDNAVSVGLINATLGMYKLEFEPAADGGRAPIRKAFEDPEVHKAMVAAIRSMR